jgi:hypothetical protein
MELLPLFDAQEPGGWSHEYSCSVFIYMHQVLQSDADVCLANSRHTTVQSKSFFSNHFVKEKAYTRDQL